MTNELKEIYERIEKTEFAGKINYKELVLEILNF